MLFAAFVSICFMANHSRSFTDDIEQRQTPTQGSRYVLPSSSSSTATATATTAATAAAAAAVGPPLMCDMKLTLERVSEHFYRIASPLDDSIQTSTEQEKGAPSPPIHTPQEGPPTGGPWQLLNGGNAEENREKRRVDNSQNQQPRDITATTTAAAAAAAADNSQNQQPRDITATTTAAAAAAAAATAAAARAAATPATAEAAAENVVDMQPEAAAATAAAAPAAAAAAAAGAPDRTPQREAELCIICCNTMASAVMLFCGHGGLCFTCAETCLHR
ncbi:hypothetical protein, conserved [Eimeria praecox]|uniref:RING-type domain-containing protein n=1 Tax=Eimeria praecox TaxID=51316 RepID=U6H256_9EIME|nr:hypothetical protein, conserved [Eimeria praecox]